MSYSGEENIQRNKAISVFEFMTSLQHNNPCTWVRELNNFGRPFLGYLYFLLSLSHLRAREDSNINKFSTLIQNHYSSSPGKGLKFTISHLFPIHVLHIKMKKKSPSNFRSCF